MFLRAKVCQEIGLNFRLFPFINNLTMSMMDVMKNKKLITIVLTVLFAIVLQAPLSAQEKASNPEQDAILTAAEDLFNFMKNKEYVSIWNLLSAKSRKVIVDSVYKESRKLGTEYNKDDLMKDFSSGGANAQAYWNSFLNVFNPSMVLDESLWRMNAVEKDYAEIIILHKKSKNPAIVKMYKEDNGWKVGLEESFGTRKANSL